MFNLLKGDITELRKMSLKRQNVVGFKYSIPLQYFTDEYYYYYYHYYYCYYYYYNCVNNKMLEYDWLLRAFTFGLIGCFRSKLSASTCPITMNCNWTDQIGQLSSQ